MTSPFLPSDVALCAAIQRRHAGTYSLATRLFPHAEREATQVFYAFVRTADDLVDEPADPDPAAIRQSFDAWSDRWRRAVAGETSDDPVIRSSATLFRNWSLPLEEAEAFLKAMGRDIDCHRYETYRELLDDYVYGSAAVVGRIMTRLCGRTDDETLAAARALGEAMQLTNFLRDIDADLQQRGRLYLALEDLRHFGVSEKDIQQRRLTPGMRSLLQEYVRRARALYALADSGIHRLPPAMRRAVRLSRILYARILDRIEAQDYDVFRRRASVPTTEKLLTAARVLLT